MKNIKKVLSILVLITMIMTQATGLIYAVNGDTTKPTIRVGAGVPGKLSDGTAVPSLGANNEAGAVVEIFGNDDSTGKSGIKQIGYSWDSTELSNFTNLPGYYRVYVNTPSTLGKHTLYVYVIDGEDNMAKGTYNFNIDRSVWDGTLKDYKYVNDKIKPKVTFSKAAGSECNPNEVVTVNVADENLVKFNYVVTAPDGNIFASNEFRGTSSAKIALGSKPGSYKISVSAVDKAMNQGSGTITYIVKNNTPTDTTRPTMAIYGPDPSSIVNGETVRYTVQYSDNVGIANILLNSGHIRLNGFTANVQVSDAGNNTKTVTLSNVQGATGGNKNITISEGSAVDAAGNKTAAGNSNAFTIRDNSVPPTPDTTRPTMAIYGPNVYSILNGQTVQYTVQYGDNIGIANILLNAGYIKLNGFTADVNVSYAGNNTKLITLNNVQGAVGNNKSITIAEGSAVDAAGNKTTAGNSNPFEIREKDTPPTPTPDTTRPVIGVYGPSPYSILNGETVKYTVQYGDNVGIAKIILNKDNIKLNGFTANIQVTDSGYNTKTITLNNIQGAIGDNKSISILEGSAEDAAGNKAPAANSNPFEIRKKGENPNPNPNPDPEVPPVTPVVPRPTPTPRPQEVPPTVVNTCVDDGLLGDINEEIKYFSSWLRAEKYTAANPQENNYAAKDETMTYMVEYYNGSTAPTPNVYFTLTIPKYTEVEEINGNGKIIEQTDQSTVIRWEMGEIKNGEKCRLYVRVKFKEDTALEASTYISEDFYAHLETNANGNISHSYMRQLFIDKNENKTGTFVKYLSALDATNAIRPDDKMTRAEFAKLLADCGIITVTQNSDKYKQYKDAGDIPVWAQDAISALIGTDIMQSYSDSTFKPNNPIIREEMIQMVAQASRYKSNTKLTISKPVFLYTNTLKDANGKVSELKDYIMELMRQNIIPKYNSRPDEYATRGEVVDIINALTNRGPFVERLPDNTMKFADIQGHKYFYGIIGASNTYEYKYDNRLWQEIISIK